jgi:uncharacterized membrane protein (UPF0127 family)
MKSMTCDSNRRTERADAGRLAAIRIAIASAVILCLVCVGCGEAPEDDGQAGLWVEIRAQRVELELTKTRQDQARGLSNRDELAWDRGMLFVYREPGFYGFWMKDMRFSIDIVWIRDDRIVDIHQRVPFSPDGPGPTVQPGPDGRRTWSGLPPKPVMSLRSGTVPVRPGIRRFSSLFPCVSSFGLRGSNNGL